jgi:hypothetical protein
VLRELAPTGTLVYSSPIIANGKVYAGLANGFVIFGEKPVGNKNVEFSDDIQLFQNYPNPFTESTEISYQIPEAKHVTLKVYNLLGEEVATLVNEYKSSGIYTVTFKPGLYNSTSDFYFCQIKAGMSVLTKKMIVMR